jgi:uncharacterized membrane protein YedE/YeeE
MKGILSRHWSFLPTGLILAALLVVFWFFNQNYLAAGKSTIAQFLENPIPTFGLVIFGAFIGAFVSGEFSIKVPITFEPLIFAAIGGFMAGIGAVIAGMSVQSVVLFNLAGVFTLPAFMIIKGWIYGGFMILGGLAASRILIWIIPKIPTRKREIHVPEMLQSKNNKRIIFYATAIVFLIFLLVLMIMPSFSYPNRMLVLLAVILLTLFGFITERGTICMSSMLKEWFMSHSAHVWRSVLFTIMCLALLYQVGLQLSLYKPIVLENYVSNPGLLVLGSFIMGFGFIFADGCFIGSLWKAGEGNVINVFGIIGLLAGIGIAQFGKILLAEQTKEATNGIPNYLSSIISPFVLLITLWVVGVLLLAIFRRKRYRY